MAAIHYGLGTTALPYSVSGIARKRDVAHYHRPAMPDSIIRSRQMVETPAVPQTEGLWRTDGDANCGLRFR